MKNGNDQNDIFQMASGNDVYRNEYLVSMGNQQLFQKTSIVKRNSQVKLDKQKQLNQSLNLGNNKGKCSSNSKSPLMQDKLNQSNDYYQMDQNCKTQALINQISPQLDNDININATGSLTQDNFDSNNNDSRVQPFYMTQVFQQNTNNKNFGKTMINNNNNQKTSNSQGSHHYNNNKSSKSQYKHYNLNNNKVQSSFSLNKISNNKTTNIVKTIQNRNKDISPLNNRLLEKYLANNNELMSSQYGINNQDFLKKKGSNNDYLNQTVPLNLTQINKMYNEEQMAGLGLTDVVNSTQNLMRINSKESWQPSDLNQQLNMSSQLYYGGNINNALINQNQIDNNQLGLTNNTQSSAITPIKDQRKKQILIKNILLQDGFNQQKNKKYFLNLTLQQLIQQQKQSQILNMFNNPQQDIKNKKSQKRLNKTVDNINNESSKMKLNDTVKANINETENQDLRSFINNFIQGAQIPQNYQDNSRQQAKSFSTSVNKFSNTMKISDFNNTQQIFPATKKSKSSLKSTQNINFQDDITSSVIHNQFTNNNAKQTSKHSALSIYSQNLTGIMVQPNCNNTYSTHGQKSRKVVSTKAGGVHINAQSSKSIGQQKHIKKNSQDKELMKMLNLYQDDTMSKFRNNDLKNKTIGLGIKTQFNAYQGQSKYKTNSTLNNYLCNFKPKQLQNKDQKQKYKSGMSNSFFNLIYDNGQNKDFTCTDEFGNQDYQQNVNYNTEIMNALQIHQYLNDQEFEKSKQQNQSNIVTSGQQNFQPYKQRKSITTLQKKDQLKEIQNKTQPIPKHILEMAQAEAINFSTGTSIIINKQPSRESNKSKSNKGGASRQISNNSRIVKSNLNTKHLKDNKFNVNKQNQIDKPKSQKETKTQQKQIQHNVQDDSPSQIYNNKNTILLDDIINSKDQDSLEIYGINDSNNQSQERQVSKLDRFILGKQIGQGAYAVVRLATMKQTGKKYAIKVYDKSKLTDTNRQRSVRREIKLLQKMNHTNIVKIYEAFETDHHVYLVMEHIGGDNLYGYLKQHKHSRLEEKEAKRIFKQLLTALQYCHRKSIAHRDIKLENILLDDEKNVKLIDFGFSTCIPNDKKIKMFCGTPSYMAPEIVNKEEYAGPPADIWASGVLLYALMNGKFPFRGDTDRDLYRRINRGTFEIHNTQLSQHLINFLTRMININADERPSAEELLQDEWFNVEVEQMSIADNEKLKKDYINDQKRLLKAKILAKIPIERNKNTICLVSSNDRTSNQLKIGANHNINLGAVNNGNQFNPLSNFRQNINDQSDYGLQNNNPMRKLNQEAYQAYYNTSGGAYGQNNNNIMQNPYYNNFFTTNNNNNLGGFYSNQCNQNPLNNNLGFNSGFQQQTRISPSKAQNMNINTNPQFFPINFTQQPPNQIGTPQVFGSPTGFTCSGNMINNNFNIINNITQVTCLPQPQSNTVNVNSQQQNSNNIPSSESSNQNNQAQQQQQNNDNTQMNFNQPIIQNMQNNQQEQQFIPDSQQQSHNDLDEDIIQSITQMGYHRSHVVSQLDCETSQIANLYNKLKEEKMSMTQNTRALSQQPHGRRAQYGLGLNNNQYHNYNYMDNDHNKAVFQNTATHNFIPSVNSDSLKGIGDNFEENSGEYTQMCLPQSNNAQQNFNIRQQNMNSNNTKAKQLSNNYTKYGNEDSSGTGEYQQMNQGSNTLFNNQKIQRNNNQNYSPKIVSLNSSDI